MLKRLLLTHTNVISKVNYTWAIQRGFPKIQLKGYIKHVDKQMEYIRGTKNYIMY